jgi:hypothetical protein
MSSWLSTYTYLYLLVDRTPYVIYNGSSTIMNEKKVNGRRDFPVLLFFKTFWTIIDVRGYDATNKYTLNNKKMNIYGYIITGVI